MGDISQLYWIKQNRELITGSVIEFGSKFYNPKTAINYRKELDLTDKYIGADISEGENVDVIIDITDDYQKIKSILGFDTFQTIICCSVLEHVQDIYKAAINISKLTAEGGILFISVPFSWEYHGYPSDYWRFTPKAIEFLFKDFEFPMNLRSISSNHISAIEKLEENPNPFVLRESILQRHWNINNPIIRKISVIKDLFFDKTYRKERLIKKILGNEYRLALSCINMVGIKKQIK